MYKNTKSYFHKKAHADLKIEAAELIRETLRKIFRLAHSKNPRYLHQAEKLFSALEDALKYPLPKEVWDVLRDIEKGKFVIEDDKKTKLYRAWAGMHYRCKSDKYPAYHRYGGRGISVCSEWEIYSNFCRWALANGYQVGLSLDRIDSDGNYEPSNCQWLTRSEHAHKARQNWRKQPNVQVSPMEIAYPPLQ